MDELTRLVEQFRVSEPSEDRLRRELKSVSPHVFAKPAAAPPARAKPKPVAREPARPIKPVAVAGGSDWTEF